jgi:DNA-binding NtrC family response regulator
MTLVLVIEDRVALRDLYVSLIRELGHHVLEAESAEEGLALLERRQVDIALCDYMLPGMNGLELIKTVQNSDIDTTMIMMTAFGEVKLAVSCMQQGAFDFLEKPIDLDYLEMTLNRALQYRLMKNQVDLIEKEPCRVSKKLIGNSPAIRELLETVDKVAVTSATCLILGESGTGKELFAERIHRKSHFAKGPFVTINCASIPAELLESELFGHEKGAFTGAVTRKKGLFELANEGTVFLDEIGELPLELQPKLLRVLQDKTFRSVGGTRLHRADIRFICATNKNLKQRVQEGAFREDLYFRLSVFPIMVPPLRDHLEDLEDLVSHFLRLFGSISDHPTPEVFHVFNSYSWPGNVRELENLIERAVILAKDQVVDLNHLPPNMEQNSLQIMIEISLDETLKENLTHAEKEVEKKLIHELLRRCGGNRSKAAASLGISTRMLKGKLERFNIDND